MASDNIKLLIALSSDYIKRLSLYLDFSLIYNNIPGWDAEEGQGEDEEVGVETGQHFEKVTKARHHVQVPGGEDLDGDEVADDPEDPEERGADALDEKLNPHLDADVKNWT